MGKELRYYQIEAKDAVLRALRRGVKKLLLLMPGGTGKTRTAVNIISEMGRKLWIVHEESLGEQGAIALLDELDLMPFNDLITTINSEGGLIQLIENSKKQVFLSENVKLIAKNVGIIKADLFDINKPIVIASAQTLHARLSKIPKDWFKVIVADECDLFFSRTFKMPLEYFEYELLLGLTATNFRADGVEMTDIFDETVYEYTLEQAIKDKYLTELNAIVVRTTTNLDDLGMMAGDFKIKELTEKVNTPQRNNLIVKKYFEYCEGQQFICFGADVDHVIALHETFEREGVKTAYVVSDKTKMVIGTDRKQIVQDYKKGSIIGLVNYNIFSAGFDAPDTGCVILACPTKSKRKFLQQLYRVTRLKSESFVKKFGQIGTILDIVDGTSKHKIINTHELDKGKPIEDRLFLSTATKQLLLEAKEKREREITSEVRKEDKRVNLLRLPEHLTVHWKGEASEGQLAWLKGIGGYDTENFTFTKKQAHEIIESQPARKREVEWLKENGYDSNGATIGNYNAAYYKHNIKGNENKWKKK